jgi:RHS repeat-associated protein
MELHKLGRKLYEFTDHLGNTLAITLDKKKGFGNDGGYYVGYYPELLALNDYYPFGMLMPDRNPAAGNGYRFGFNGQEKVNEIAGVGNHYTALFWEYDSRLGRRWNIDPKYTASESRYATFGNNPIFYTDPLGDFKTKFGAWAYKTTHGGGEIGRDTKSGQYFVGNKVEYTGEGVGIAYKRTFDWNGRGSAYDGSGWGHQTRSLIANIFGVNGKSDNLFSVGLNSILQSESVELTGAMLDKVKNDPAIIDFENSIVERVQGKEAGTYNFSQGLQLGGKRGSLNPLSKESAATWKVAGNPLTWVVRSVNVQASVQVNAEGGMNITYQFVDNLDLRPEKDGKVFFGGSGNSPFSSEGGSRPWQYNAASSVLGVPYHDVVGGNDKMKVKATWTSER